MAPSDDSVEYRNCPGHPGYRVGSDGSVWSCLKQISMGHGKGFRLEIGTTWRPLKPMSRSRYLNVSIRKSRFSVHVLVLTAFRGPCPPDMEACHNDGDPTNNRLENLRWDTRKANQADRIRHGTDNWGEKHPLAKLTDEQTAAIRAEFAAGGITQTALSRRYGVSCSLINQIVLRRIRNHVSSPPG